MHHQTAVQRYDAASHLKRCAQRTLNWTHGSCLCLPLEGARCDDAPPMCNGRVCNVDTGQTAADAAASFHAQGKEMRRAREQAALEQQQAAQPKQKQKHKDKHKSGPSPQPAVASGLSSASADPSTQLNPTQRWAGGVPDLSLHWRLPHQDLHGTHHLYDCWPKVSHSCLLCRAGYTCLSLMSHLHYCLQPAGCSLLDRQGGVCGSGHHS